MRARVPGKAAALAGAVAAAGVAVTARSALSQRGEPQGDVARQLLGAPVTSASGPAITADDGQRLAWLRERLDDLTSSGGPVSRSRVGVAVADLDSGRLLYERGVNRRYSVASNTKLVTTAAALARLGPDYRFATAVYADDIDDRGRVEGDLTVRGTGDPSLGTEDLRELAYDLELAGINRVEGGITVDDSLFDDDHLPPHFESYEEPSDEHAAYRAPIGAASLNFNMISVVVTPSPSGRGPAAVALDPPNDYARLTGSVHTVRRGRTRVRVEVEERDDRLALEVTGRIRPYSGVRRIRRRVPHPARYLGGTLRALLRERGIEVERERIDVDGEVPDDANLVASRQSPPLSVLVRGMGKYSNNYVAEMLLKTIGAEAIAGHEDRAASWSDGLAAVREFLTGEVGLEPGGFRYDNGSGLFDASEFSPRDLVAVLSTAYRDFRYGPELVGSLSLAGTDGTLRSRLTDGPAARLVRAKTGTLEHVSALSGYAAVDGRAPLAFSVLVDEVPEGGIGYARALQDDVAEALIRYLRGGP